MIFVLLNRLERIAKLLSKIPTCTKQVSGVTADSIVRCGAAPESEIAASEAHVYCSAQGAGTLTFSCVTVPAAAVTMNIEVWEA